MGDVTLQLDQRTQDRALALAMLQQDLAPGRPWTAEEALRQALVRGLDVLLVEALAHTGPVREGRA